MNSGKSVHKTGRALRILLLAVGAAALSPRSATGQPSARSFEVRRDTVTSWRSDDTWLVNTTADTLMVDSLVAITDSFPAAWRSRFYLGFGLSPERPSLYGYGCTVLLDQPPGTGRTLGIKLPPADSVDLCYFVFGAILSKAQAPCAGMELDTIPVPLVFCSGADRDTLVVLGEFSVTAALPPGASSPAPRASKATAPGQWYTVQGRAIVGGGGKRVLRKGVYASLGQQRLRVFLP
jgi:hypothetical protein